MGQQADKHYVTRTVSRVPVHPSLHNELISDASALVSFLTNEIGWEHITRVKH